MKLMNGIKKCIRNPIIWFVGIGIGIGTSQIDNTLCKSYDNTQRLSQYVVSEAEEPVEKDNISVTFEADEKKTDVYAAEPAEEKDDEEPEQTTNMIAEGVTTEMSKPEVTTEAPKQQTTTEMPKPQVTTEKPKAATESPKQQTTTEAPKPEVTTEAPKPEITTEATKPATTEAKKEPKMVWHEPVYQTVTEEVPVYKEVEIPETVHCAICNNPECNTLLYTQEDIRNHYCSQEWYGNYRSYQYQRGTGEYKTVVWDYETVEKEVLVQEGYWEEVYE